MIDHLRGVLILLHIVAITLIALPAPGGAMNRAAWKDPTVQGELSAWAGRLGVERDDLEDALWRIGTDYMAARGAVLAPFQPYYRWCGTWQSWRMFVAPHRFPAKLVIDLRENGVWTPIYEERSPLYTWNVHRFDHDRMQSSVFRYAWPQYKRSYEQMTRWIAAEAARDFPAADAVRVRFLRYRTPSPEQVRAGLAPEGSFERERVVAW